jgi:hypothetical protein
MADVAGYSRLMNRDESGTVAALDSARAARRSTTTAAASSTWPATRSSPWSYRARAHRESLARAGFSPERSGTFPDSP